MNLVCGRKFSTALRKAKAKRSKAQQGYALHRRAKARFFRRFNSGGGVIPAGILPEVHIPTRPGFLIQNISDTQQVFRRPEMDVDFFRRPGIGMPENCADELHGDAFSVQRCGEIVPQGMWPESWYPGVPGKFFTQTV